MLRERYGLDNGYVVVETEKNANICIMTRKEFNRINDAEDRRNKQKNKKAVSERIIFNGGGTKMNRMEFKESNEYKKMIEKIKSYSKGFRFNIPYYKMTTGQKNAMHIVTNDCIKEKIIESVSFGLDLSGNVTEQMFVRL